MLDSAMQRFPITPVPKPRQTRRDKWKERDCVLRYRAFKDEVRVSRLSLEQTGQMIVFILPMPASWSKKKREAMRGMPHEQKPDTDNLIKAIYDAVTNDDAGLYHTHGLKFWGDEGEIIIYPTARALAFDGSKVVWQCGDGAHE